VAVLACLFCVSTASSAPSIFDEDYVPPKAPGTPRVTVPASRPVATGNPLPVSPVKPPAPVPTIPRPAQVTKRHPVPSKPEQEKSRKLLREIYLKQLADRSVPARQKLAQDLMAEATRAADQAVDQFVLLAAALDAAREGSSVRAVIEAGDAMAKAFDVDALAIKADAVSRMNLAASSAPTAISHNQTLGLSLVNQLMEAEDFATAGRICAVLQSVNNPDAAARAAVQHAAKSVGAARVAQEKAIQAVARLRTQDDPAASATFGAYACLYKHEWSDGLPYLAAGADSLLKAAAKADLAASADAAASPISVGDAWWDAAEKSTSAFEQAALRGRAAEWYRKALAAGNAAGLIRTRIEKRLETLTPPAVATNSKTTVAPIGKSPAEVRPPEPGPAGQAAVPAAQSQTGVEVAQKLRGNQKPAGVAAGIITFTAPHGNGRRGANGVLLKVADDWQRDGTTWRLHYQRSGSAYGLQIIHPWRNGQVVVAIQKDGIRVHAGGAWSAIGYGGKGGLAVKDSPGLAQLLPIDGDRDRELVSRLDARGNYALYIDGQLAVLCTVTNAEPLDLQIKAGAKVPRASTRDELKFTGEGLPTRLEPGQAMIIVEPLDSGANVASNIVLVPGIVKP
jgi:hypothetical protein